MEYESTLGTGRIGAGANHALSSSSVLATITFSVIPELGSLHGLNRKLVGAGFVAELGPGCTLAVCDHGEAMEQSQYVQ